ncbi:MAG TPA: cupredoxin domain-containing protein [Candidatus Limnocylindria bacterium]|nr:cupredoxin domain-containing protein [Candidatus Limnocylindria bacterium]
MRTRSRLAAGRLVAGTAGVAVLALGVTAAALAARGGGQPVTTFEIAIHYSHFEPSAITVPAGVPVTITLRNDDPIDHEWIVGDEAVHAFHRTGTEQLHPSRPTEVVIPAGETRTTVVTFAQPGSLRYICHLPAHKAYGMVGAVTIR